jgi:hypothetical protein
MADPSLNGRYGTARRRRTAARRFELLNAFWDEGTARTLPRTAALIWLALWRHARPDRTVRLSFGKLAWMVGTCRQTAIRSVRRLRGERLLKLVKRGGPGRGPSTYKLLSHDPTRPGETGP